MGKWIARHHEKQAEAARDGVAYERGRGNEAGAQAWERVAREADAKADKAGKGGR